VGRQLESGHLEIWTEDLRNEPVQRLKELNSDERAHLYARTILLACVRLAPRYGHFIINENMVFFNPHREIFAWINPEVLENHVKIYLPAGPDGEQAMMRSLLAYFKLWLKRDYVPLAEAKHLEELLVKFDHSRRHEEFKPRSPERNFLANRRNSANFQPGDPNFARYSGLGRSGQPEVRSNQEIMGSRSPGREADLHRTFNTTAVKASLNQSAGGEGGYFPNRTTSKVNHPIVQLINSQDDNPHEYRPNRLLEGAEEREVRKMKESLGGIGEEVNDLFKSNIESEDNREDEMKQIEEEFGGLLD
jgi:hypothetical protein